MNNQLINFLTVHRFTQIFQNFIGFAGLKKSEPLHVQKMNNCIQWLMLSIVIWLPFQWYFRDHQLLSAASLQIDHWIIWAIFTLEILFMVYFARYKLSYLLTNWLHLLIIVIAFPPMSHHWPVSIDFRIIYSVIIVSILIPWIRIAREFLLRNRLGTTMLVFISMAILAGLLFDFIEPNIKHPFDGIWWAFQTVTTLGYGDTIPVTLVGRIFALLVMILGIGLLSLLTANFSAFLIKRDDRKYLDELEQLNKKINEIHIKLNKIDQIIQVIDKEKYSQGLPPQQIN